MSFWCHSLDPGLADLAGKKPGFSLAFQLGLLVGSFLDMADLQPLRNAKISIFPHFIALPAFCDVSTWSERPLDFLEI